MLACRPRRVKAAAEGALHRHFTAGFRQRSAGPPGLCLSCLRGLTTLRAIRTCNGFTGRSDEISLMKVLLIGSGGREHALAWKLAASPRVTALFALPGNPGIGQLADLVPIGVMEFDAIAKFVKQNRIEFVVIGPEDPLAAGLADRLADAGVKVFGPSREGARLEADKWFA